jgi:hypothetical protein
MLLAALALCLLCGLLVHRRHFAPTSFFGSFGYGKAIDAACARLGFRNVIWGGGGMSAHERTRGDAHCAYEIFIESLPSSESERVLGELKTEVESLLNKHGCHFCENGLSPGVTLPASEEWSGFNLEYSQGSTEGSIYVYAVKCPHPNHWHLFIQIHEWLGDSPIGR